MKVNFKGVKIEGFLSVGLIEIGLDSKNIVLVEGKNNSGLGLSSNGSGKSCIFEAIYWAITGKTIRGTKEVINKYYKGFASVKVSMEINEDEFLLSRYREHPEHGNNLIIHKNGENISGTGIKKSEQILANELPFLTEDLIGSVIILGQGLPSKFTNYDPSGRKEILEVLSGNLGIIDGMKDILTNYRDSLSKDISEKNMELRGLESVLELRRKDVEEMKRHQGQSKESIDKLRKTLNEKEKLRDDTQEKLDIDEEKLSKIERAIQTSETNKRELGYKLKEVLKNIENVKNDLISLRSDKCPTCGQDLLDEEFIKKTRLSLKRQLVTDSGSKEALESDISSIDGNLNIYNEKYTNLNEVISEKRDLTIRLKNDIIDLNGKISQATDYTEKIKEYEKEISENDALYYKINTELNDVILEESIIDYVLREVGRDFRGFMLGSVVNYLNTVLKEIASELYGKEDLKLILEDNKIEIEYEGRSYSSLSGGEQRRADLAMQFALRNLLVNSLGFSSNILVVDEILDGLDSVGVDSLIKFIANSLGDIESIFIITHHSALPIPYDDKIVITKDKNMISNLGS